MSVALFRGQRLSFPTLILNIGASMLFLARFRFIFFSCYENNEVGVLFCPVSCVDVIFRGLRYLFEVLL